MGGSGLPHVRLLKRRSPSQSGSAGSSSQQHLTCWHILAVIKTIISTAFACYLVVQNVTYLKDLDTLLEQCTVHEGADETAGNYMKPYQCNYLELWDLKRGGDVNDPRCFLQFFCLTVTVLAVHYIMASVLLVIGIAQRLLLAFAPWILVKTVVNVFLFVLLMSEFHLVISPAMTSGDHQEGHPQWPNNTSYHVAFSQHFVLVMAILSYSVFNWIMVLLTFFQLKNGAKPAGKGHEEQGLKQSGTIHGNVIMSKLGNGFGYTAFDNACSKD